MSKVIRPILRDVFPRKRLFILLDQMRKQSAIWVSGPAGSGKTTLVNSYLETRGIPCLWYEVDEGDTDLATFFCQRPPAMPEVADFVIKMAEVHGNRTHLTAFGRHTGFEVREPHQ